MKVYPDAVFPEATPLAGRDQFRGLLEETWSAWSSLRVTPKESRDLGDGRVLVRSEWSATGAGSGLAASTNLSAIFTVRDGQISQADYFMDHEKALKAVALEQ